MGFWDGLISGFNKASAAGRAEAQAKADQEYALTTKALDELSAENVDPTIRTAAIAAKMEMAAGRKPPKGGFLAYLTGTQTPPSYPGVEAVMKMIGPQHVPGLTVTTPTPPPPPAQAPSGASGAMVRSAGGPSSPAQLTTPPPPAPVGGPPSLGNVQPGVVPSTLTAGTPHQTAGATYTPQVFRSKADLLREEAIAKKQAEVEGSVAGWMAVGKTREEATRLAEQDLITQRSTGAPFQSIAGEVPDGKGGFLPAFATLNKVTGNYEGPDGQPLPGFRPRTTTGSVSYGADREAISMTPQFGGKPYAQLSLPQRAAVDAEVQRRVGANAFARTAGTEAAQASADLSTSERFQAITRLQDTWQKIEQPARIMRQQLSLMEVALQRATADPAGSTEGIRVTFEKILDPLSVVREAEYERQGAGLSIIDRLRGTIQKYVDGGGNIPLPILQEMVETARQFVAVSQHDNDDAAARLDETARGFKIDPALIRGVRSGTGGPAATPPPPAVPGTTPPPPATTAPANAPRVGSFVGNEYHGPLGTDRATGQRVGQGADGKPVPIYQGPDGKWYFQGAPQ